MTDFARCLILATALAQMVSADDRATIKHFENEIRPLLIEHCVKCHGPKKSESGLRLDTRAMALRGGENGPAVSPGRPDDSLLFQAVRQVGGLEMPPDKKLDAREIAAIELWIQQGAVWPDGISLGGDGPALRSGSITEMERACWSFQPVADPHPPALPASLMARNAIDQFVHAKLVSAGLVMRTPADKRTLLRRATFDLTGLPPSMAEMDAFLSDNSPDAFAKVVDRLLDTQAYGEQWGRHWLDVVRYADTAGETADYPTPLSYKYRNWVIQAFNGDMPYDEFIRQQIAGDLLAKERFANSHDIHEEIRTGYKNLCTATGFIAISRRFGFDVENYHYLTIQDTIDVVGQSVLGLTLGCARCHDHKYDPVNMADYYAWYGIFESTRYSFPGSEEKKKPYDSFPALPPQVTAELQAKFNQRLAALDADILKCESELKSSGQPTAGSIPAQQRLKELTVERNKLAAAGPFTMDDLIYGAIDRDLPADTKIQLRGENNRLGDVAPRRNLEILGGELIGGGGSGRRQLADWLTRPQNPLTARVMVNRIWQQHFGRGIVGTENDFGARGERPTHPELLDWLASRFVESGWSIKSMHRVIMASAAYQQSSAYDAQSAVRDPDARLLWRFNRRRLGAEEIRDAMLLVSGQLDGSMGGPHTFPAVDSWSFTQHNPFYGDYPTTRRSTYMMQQRLKRHPFLALFDGADPNVSTARRQLTTVPTQALFLMNNDFVHEQAAAFARRLIGTPGDEVERIELAHRLAFGRSATADEQREAREFLATYRDANASTPATVNDRELAVWGAFARTVLTRNEFLFVD